MEVMELFKIGGVAIMASVLYNTLNSFDRKDLANLMGLGGTIIVLLMVVDMLQDLFQIMKTFVM